MFDVRLERVAKESLFRSIGRNRGRTKIPHTKDPQHRLASLANPLSLPITQPAAASVMVDTAKKWLLNDSIQLFFI